MSEHDDLGVTRKRVGLALAAFVSPPLAGWLALTSLLRKRGWRYALVIASAAGNFVFVSLMIFVIMDWDNENSSPPERERPASWALPDGLVWRSEGSLFFAELAANKLGRNPLASTVFLVRDGCILAAMEFDDARKTIKEMQFYDEKCRPRLTFEREKGGIMYTWYGDLTHPDYTVHDLDGDGVPDRRIDWNPGGSRSFVRRADVEWEAVNASSGGGGASQPK